MANAVTYGGYVNVSRQNLDFLQRAGQNGQILLDTVANDLAEQYTVETERKEERNG